ncbi:MAG: DNA recombination protein RmuC [Candidatus Omnitrophota bacterium]|jgi:DNA recombination protein RmuC
MVIVLVIASVLAVFAVFFVLLRLYFQISSRMDAMAEAVRRSGDSLNKNIGDTLGVFGGVQDKLARVEEVNRRIYEIGRDISSLQELLRAPKFRGKFAETFLENLLSQVLPPDFFQAQYRFRTSDTVDAVIRLGERLLPVDAKFSLENFQKMTAEPQEQARAALKKKFVSDVKDRTDEIASKYILPAENTYDFAFMYIPAENVYYEIIATEDLLSYLISRRVYPVSPLTFYAYLQIICLGLKGLRVEENAERILKTIASLSGEINKFRDDYQLVGRHLQDAGRKYEESSRKLEKLAEKIASVDRQENDV